MKSDRKSRLELDTLDALMLLDLDDDQMHYIGNLNKFSASFCSMYVFNIARYHIIFILNTNTVNVKSFFFFLFLVKYWEKN